MVSQQIAQSYRIQAGATLGATPMERLGLLLNLSSQTYIPSRRLPHGGG
jgi:hypothetical protein